MTVAEIIESLERARAARRDPLDLERERQTYITETEQLDRRIFEVRAIPMNLQRAEERVRCAEWAKTTTTGWFDFLTTTRPRLCEQLLAVAQRGRARTRDEIEAEALLQTSIQSIDFGLRALPGADTYSLKSLPLGQIMREAGMEDLADESLRVYGGLRWRGSLPEAQRAVQLAEVELTHARQDLAAAQHAYDALIASWTEAPAMD